ncbi:MAG: hypothetical protein GJ676_07925 [Rhodobacteraceae bacterium]|nr:hypothetical protein [Paracoccaceae bacterium]
MRVVVARISALGQLDDNLDDVTSLQNNYKQAQALMEARETSPNGTDYCLAPDTVANLWVRISRLNALIGENVTFE